MDGGVERASWLSTITACFAIVIIYFFLVFFVAPIVEAALDWHSRVFVPARYGGGEESPGLLTLLIRGVMLSGGSAAAAFFGVLVIFRRANLWFVAWAFALAMMAWTGLYAYVAVVHGAYGMLAMVFFLGALPAAATAFALANAYGTS